MTSETLTPITNCKYKDWLKNYTFDTCKLNRREYGEFLASYIAGERDGFVLNLNGAWGTGKTQFLRRLYSLLCGRGYPTIYIDAWESDFSEIPLSVVASELINQLSMINENIGGEFEKIQQFLGKALKGTIVGGTGLLTKHFLDEASVGTEAAKALFEKTDQDYLKDVMGNHVEQIEAIKNIRDQLAQLAEVLKQNFSYELPVVVLVDELDRCRPNYAIEMLEVIKHFFTTKNFVFVVATDSEQLQHSIKSVYGSDFDSMTYLKRFFDREASLSTPDLQYYIRFYPLEQFANSEGLVLYPYLANYQSLEIEGLNRYLYWVALAYKLSIRDIDQLQAKLSACLRYAEEAFKSTNSKQYINIFSLMVVIVELDNRLLNINNKEPEKNDLLLNYQTTVFLEMNRPWNGKRTSFTHIRELLRHFSVKHTVKVKDHFGHEQEQQVYGHDVQTKFRPSSALAEQVYNDISSTVECFLQEKKNSKFWLWDDYIKLAQLAGNIT
ncbi:KAP family P-loop NTPase fold protein [Pseudoalteromonas sp. T1lg10]|uniref:KAP family P-loop NTPase fold protein n=1 Tax=Pseudoalteromonas sp. T1lg10 TaxID=2077093 RepID=UPI000CF73094|nr:P-loop NTPase fold protein [Pseudoalteromonas sp. T1lg10]